MSTDRTLTLKLRINRIEFRRFVKMHRALRRRGERTGPTRYILAVAVEAGMREIRENWESCDYWALTNLPDQPAERNNEANNDNTGLGNIHAGQPRPQEPRRAP